MKKLFLFLILLGTWLLLTGNLEWLSVLAGAVTALVLAILFSDLFIEHPLRIFNPIRIFWFFCYVPIFLWACLKANLDVAYRVIHPNLPINPGIVRVKTTLKTDLAKTVLANSITLTPGTLTVDILGENMYIHWINIRTTDPQKETELIVGQFERLIRRIFE